MVTRAGVSVCFHDYRGGACDADEDESGHRHARIKRHDGKPYITATVAVNVTVNVNTNITANVTVTETANSPHYLGSK